MEAHEPIFNYIYIHGKKKLLSLFISPSIQPLTNHTIVTPLVWIESNKS